MKRICFFLLMGALSLVVSSCEKDLEFTPDNGITEIKTIAQLELAVRGVYEPLIPNDGGLHSVMFIYGDARSDDFDYAQNNGHLATLAFAPLVNANIDYTEQFFRTLSFALGRLQFTLEKAANFPEEEKTTYPEEFDKYVAELHALNGWLHFEMARLYAHIPANATDLDAPNSGIPLIKEPINYDYKASRSTLRETYTYIVDELEASLEKITSEKSKDGRITDYGVQAILSRVYLYMGEWQKAAKCAMEVLNADEGYKLLDYVNGVTTKEQLYETWNQNDFDESIFELRVDEKHSADRYSFSYLMDKNGYNEFVLNRAFYKSYGDDTLKDARLSMLVQLDTASDQPTKKYQIMKYVNPKQDLNVKTENAAPNMTTQPRIIRLSEMYLTLIECGLRGADISPNTAQGLLDEFLKTRIAGYSAGDKTATLDEVLAQRGLEFIGEGQRMYDMLRFGKTVKRTVSIDGDIEPNGYNAICQFPAREIILSEGSLVQNPSK